MKKIILIVFYICISTLGVYAHAQTKDYTVLAPLPGTTKSANCTGNNCTADINSYLGGFLGLTITIGAVLAMIYLGLYGFQYATSDSAPKKSEYKDKIWTILQGLLLILSAYTIMYTINPKLTQIELNLISPKLQAVPTVETTTGAALENPDEKAIRTQLVGISVNADPCAPNQTRGCTNLAGLPQYAVNRLNSLKNICGCDLMITGGTEGGHASHGPGQAKVDLRPSASLNQYLGVTNPREGQVVFRSINGMSVKFTYEEVGGNQRGTSTGNHWHVDIN